MRKLKEISLLIAASGLLGFSYIFKLPRVLLVSEFIFWGAVIYNCISIILPSQEKKIIDVKEVINGQEVVRQETKFIDIIYNNYDLIKTTFLCIIYCCVIFIYTAARQLKDSLVIASAAGNEGAAVAKLVVPIASTIFQIVYMWLLHHLEYKRVSYFLNILFIVIFAIFALFCVNATGLNMSIIPGVAILKSIFGWMPSTIGNMLINIMLNWPSILFYVAAEVYGAVLLTTFFWQLNSRYVNKNVIVGNNRMITVIAQLGSLAAGYVGSYIGDLMKLSTYTAVKFFTITVMIASIIKCVANYFLFDVIEKEYENTDAASYHESHKKKGGPKKGILAVIHEYPQLLLLALLNVFYGITLVLIEQFFKWSLTKYIKESTPDATNNQVRGIYSNLYAEYMKLQSRGTLLSSLFLPYILSFFFKWTGFALTTPIFVLIGSVLLFGLPLITSLFGITLPITILAVSAMVIVAILKIAKYILFDSSREMMVKYQGPEKGRELKNIEGLISRYGKSGGSVIFLFCSSFNLSMGTMGLNIVMLLLGTIMSIVWIYAVLSVSDEMKDVSM